MVVARRRARRSPRSSSRSILSVKMTACRWRDSEGSMGRWIGCALVVGVWLAATGPALTQTRAEWDQTVAAAKAEGSVTLYTGLIGSPTSSALAKQFSKEYG